MNFNILILGLIALFLGLIGLIAKSHMKDQSFNSYTGAHFLWSTYSLLVGGAFLVILSFFTEQK